MARSILSAATLLGALAVALGAFGAHGLKQLVAADALQVYETGVRYHFYHVFALLSAGLLAWKEPLPAFRRAARFFLTGILFFSGSLYLFTFMKAAAIKVSPIIAVITPLGGLLLIAGWIFLFLGIQKMM